jgi:hypothetical protein
MPRSQSLKIAFISTFDALNIEAWSGIPYYMAKSFKQQSIQIHYICALKERFSFLYKIKQGFYRYILSRKYFRDREPAILKSYAE